LHWCSEAATYHAGVNLEHIRGIVPDSPFKNYGNVDSLSAAENNEGKLQLFAVISPTDDLVKMNQAKQKLFTSAEVSPNFAGTGQACGGKSVLALPGGTSPAN
jgi:hypothetical protein